MKYFAKKSQVTYYWAKNGNAALEYLSTEKIENSARAV